MSGWYDGWREAKRRLRTNPDDEFLKNLVDNLRGPALQEYVEQFAYVNGYEYPEQDEHITESVVSEFLAGLDDLREPPQTAVDEARAKAFHEALEVLGQMKNLNWTGDHLYGDALDDAQVILSHVRAGRKWPVLERFRCPSEYGSRARQNERVRCELQLPHESKHQARNTAGGEGFMWADEQSVNPPVPYDGPSTVPCPCTFYRSGVARVSCMLPAGHGPNHRAEDGTTWVNDYQPDRDAEGACGAPHVITGKDGGAETVHCSMFRGHAGPSHFDVRSGSSWPVS